MNESNITILSLNVWHGNLLEELIDYLQSKIEQTSIFCFQEADPKVHNIIKHALGDKFNVFATEKYNENYPYYNSTFIRSDIKVVGVKTVLGDMNDVGLGLFTAIEIDGNRSLAVVNVHGRPYPGDKLDTTERLKQTKSLLASVENYISSSVFIGDFNLMPQSSSVKMFEEQGYSNLIKDFDISTTRNENSWKKYPENKQLFADYAFIKTEENSDYNCSVENNMVSDHLPLILELKLSSR